MFKTDNHTVILSGSEESLLMSDPSPLAQGDTKVSFWVFDIV